MGVHIRSGSAAVQRTLTDLAQAAGLSIEAQPHEASLLVDDHFHPAKGNVAHTNQLALGANPGDTGIACPVRPAVLAQQMRARAMSGAQVAALASGWALDTAARQLNHPDNAAVPLTEKESLLLAALAAAYPEACKRDALLKSVWAYDDTVETHTLETHIYRLRAKLTGLTPRPCDIVTLDASYRLVKE